MILRWTLAAALILAAPAFAAAPDKDGYTNIGPTLDGIGKSYMGREIAYVMGHEAAQWLDRPERNKEEGSERLVSLLGLKPNDAVADIGAGSGYFSFRLAAAVPQGYVYAVDIQKEMLDMIKERQARTAQGKAEGANIVTVLGGVADPRLKPNTIDLILLVDAYHEFSYPREMGLAMARALKPGGRIALVEYRGEDPKVPIRDTHRMTQAQAKKEMAAVGLTWLRTDDSLPWQHLMFFTKP
ncbi:MAG: methyltransferase domain-containing protein [Rhodospirillaceae bacterium]|nr:methyltransferase domain-containing protein [Rhodospirillaceae bacterium]